MCACDPSSLYHRRNSAAEYQRQYGDGNSGELMKHQFNDMITNVPTSIVSAHVQRNGVTATTYHSHDNQNCIETVNASMSDTALGLEGLMFVRMHAKIGKKKKFDLLLYNIEGHLDILVSNEDTHKMFEAHHAGNIITAVSSKLKSSTALNIPILLSPDNGLVAEYVKSPQYRAVLQKAEQEFRDAGGYGKDWPVRLNA